MNAPSKHKHYVLIVLIIIISGIGTNLNATNYYVSTSGSDGDIGTIESPWKTVAHVNEQTFAPGDSILFRRGDTWRRDVLLVPSSGNSSKQITFGAYGSGKMPELLGSIKVENWTKETGNIWSSATVIPRNPFEIDTRSQIFFVNTDTLSVWGKNKTFSGDFSELSKDYDWAWDNENIYIYSSSDPNTTFISVEAPQTQEMIKLNDKSYISFNGLAIKYLVNAGIADKYTPAELNGLRVTNCEIAYIGIKNSSSAYGVTVHQSDLYIGFNEFHDCGRRAVSTTMYSNTPNITVENLVIENNHFYNGFHTTGVDCNNAGGHKIHNVTIRNNFFEGDPREDLGSIDGNNSNHIFLANQGSGSIYGFKIYNNIFTYSHASSIKIEAVDSIEIYFNTFYGFNPTLSNYQAHVYSYYDPLSIIVKNNIFFNNAVDSKLTDIKLDEAFRSEFTIDYNLYYHVNEDTRLMQINNGTHQSYANWEDYKSFTGFDNNSPVPADILFINEPSNLGILETSPAIGAGIKIDWINVDYYGSEMKDNVDVGALQFGSEPNLNPSLRPSGENKGLDLLEDKIVIFPNPARDLLSLTNFSENSFSVLISDLSGKIVYDRFFYAGTLNVKIPIINMSEGMYLVQFVFENDKYSTKKLIVMR